jgi:NAD(P)-dependent dehydrogenase (short-subunit alcohol dehydrogenase family)
MDGRVCMVTGSNSGIGKATAMALAKLGSTIVMVCRDRNRGESSRAEIRERSGNESIDLMIADLSSLQSVRQLAGDFVQKYKRLDVLINNAGLVCLTRSTTVDGLETTFSVNYLSQFLLTNLLLPVLRTSTPARIVCVSSSSHYGAGTDFDPKALRRYSIMRAYGQSKLAQILFTHELARRLEGSGVTINCLHPGAVATKMWSRFPMPLNYLSKVVTVFLKSPEEGAETVLYLASSPEVDGVSGKYFVNRKEAESSSVSYNAEAATRLWQLSEELTGLSR